MLKIAKSGGGAACFVTSFFLTTKIQKLFDLCKPTRGNIKL